MAGGEARKARGGTQYGREKNVGTPIDAPGLLYADYSVALPRVDTLPCRCDLARHRSALYNRGTGCPIRGPRESRTK
jgi:hypothetical protein